MLDPVIAMARYTTGQTSRFERSFVGTLFEQLRLKDMASRAHILHAGHAGRRRAMVSMTGSAGWSTQVSPFDHSFVMNAFAVVSELCNCKTIGLHIRGVRMTVAAGHGHIKRIDRRPNIAGGTDFVNAMAVCSDGHFGVTRGEFSPVNAGAILGQLIGAQGRIVLSHVGSVGMALATQFRNILPRDFAFEASLRAHSIVGAGGIPAMTTGAGESLLRVNIGGKRLGVHFQWVIERRMAIETGVWGLGKRTRQQQKESGRQPHQEYVPHP